MTSVPPPIGGQPGWQPSVSTSLDISVAVKWAWRKFRANTSTLVLNTLVLFVVGIGVYVAAFLIAHSVVPHGSLFLKVDERTGQIDGLGDYFALLGVLYLALFVLVIPLSVLSAGFLRSGLRIADGETPGFFDMFTVKNAPRIMLTNVLISMGSLVGMIFCYLPGLAFAVFAGYAIPILIERGLGPVASIEESFRLVKPNFWNAVLVAVVTGVIATVGMFACLIGILVSAPVAMLIHIYAYRYFSGGRIEV
ncbi:MAG: hypothetical protein ABIR57_12750 [Aeromicrobium sp.]